MSNFETLSPLMPSLTGTAPQYWIASTSDNLSAITTAGYLNDQSNQVKPNDVFLINYADTTSGFPLNTNLTATLGQFVVTYSAPNWSLVLQVPEGLVGVVGTPATGNLAEWASSTTIEDSGVPVANVMLTSATNQMAAGASVLLDKGTGTEAAGAVTINKQAGVITTVSLTTAALSTHAITLTNSEVKANSVVDAFLMGGTNTTVGVQVSATAAVGSSVITISNTNATTAFNGTLLIGFTVA